MDNIFKLDGKRILVTGASSGIGRASAIECSKMGASIVANARNSNRLTETMDMLCGGEHISIIADLTDEDALKSMVAEMPEVDGVVLCAGKSVNLPIKFADRDHFNDIFEPNFFSTVELIRLLVKNKKIKKGGSIVIIDSVGGITRFAVSGAIYGCTKAALNSFSKFAAREFAPRKIRVNCICPGMIDTPLIHRGTVTEEQLAEDAKKYPLARYGKPEEVAYGVVYLLSDASSWVTGTSLFIDGGLSII